MTTKLADLDELILLCRSQSAQDHIREAVACYRAGAFRSAIISTWIAVVFDVIEKLRDLALTGDNEAEEAVARFESIHQRSDLKQALDFERGLLAECSKKFELFSPLECEDIERLQSDRNRCAHPNLIRYGEVYSPSAELARTHIRNAVEHVLQQPPKVGKPALEGLFKEVQSEYFPIDADQAFEVLRGGALARPKENLVRNFVLGMTTCALKGDLPARDLSKRVAAIQAALRLQREVFLGMIKSHLPKALSKTPDPGLKCLLLLLRKMPELNDAIDPGLRARLTRCVQVAPQDDLPIVVTAALGLSDFKEVCLTRVAGLGSNAIATIVSMRRNNTPEPVIDRALQLYETAGNFADANDTGDELLKPCLKAFSKPQVLRLFDIADKNGQVRGSTTFDDLVSTIRDYDILTADEFRESMKVRRWGGSFLDKSAVDENDL